MEENPGCCIFSPCDKRSQREVSPIDNIAEVVEDLITKLNKTSLCFYIALGKEHLLLTVIQSNSAKCKAMVNENFLDGWTPVHLAAACGRKNIMQLVIEEAGGDPNIPTNGSLETPVHVACRGPYSRKDIVRRLTNVAMAESMARSSVSSQYNREILDQVKLASDKMAVAKYLLELPATDESIQDADGVSVLKVAYLNSQPYAEKFFTNSNFRLIQAIFYGEKEKVHYIVNSKEGMLNERFCMGWAPIHMAVAFGRVDIVKFLVDDCKADPSTKTKNSENTPLHICIMKTSLAAALTNKQAFVETYNSRHARPHKARAAQEEKTEEKFKEIQRYLENRKNCPSSYAKYVENMKELLNYFWNMSEVPDVERTKALRLAIKHQSKEAFLIIGKAYGQLVQAVIDDDDKQIKKLKEDDTNFCSIMVNETVIHGWALIHIAVALRNMKAFKALHECFEASTKVVTEDDQQTILHLALMKKSSLLEKIKRKLNLPVEKGRGEERHPAKLNLEKLTEDQEEPDRTIIEELLSKKFVDVNAKDRKGFTALHMCILNDENDILDTLLQHKAKFKTYNIYGETPLYTAVEVTRTEAAKKLIEKGISGTDATGSS